MQVGMRIYLMGVKIYLTLFELFLGNLNQFS